MWTKVGERYLKNLVISGTGFVIRVNDSDGCRVIGKSSRRNIVSLLGKAGIACTVGTEGLADADIINGKLVPGTSYALTFKKGAPWGYTGTLVCSESLAVRPLFGIVCNECDALSDKS